ncbi:MAG: sulfate adenylyltransferase [Ardenticatenia bacterium]|nr:sulfate adenylyltransferase [Ardenticatenia bacterium]
MSTHLISPHGGTLVNRVVTGEASHAFRAFAEGLPRLSLDAFTLSDLDLLAVGAYSPLTGFMGHQDYESVLHTMRLADGTAWPLPIVLRVTEETWRALGADLGDTVALATPGGRPIGLLEVRDVFAVDPDVEAICVFGTADRQHPGVARLYRWGRVAIGGPIWLFDGPQIVPFPHYHLEPAQTRRAFAERGWRRVVAFQTRNPIHRAHEHLMRTALEVVDGLLVHPLVGETKADDVPAWVRLRSYERLIETYFPKDRVMLSVFPAAMRYAGPREAVFHALVRKNYGCSHFIVGRDHAGVGGYYGPYEAHHVFERFRHEELGMTLLFFENAFYCHRCGSMVTVKTCPHDERHHVRLSGTNVRRMLAAGQHPPGEILREEVASVLIESYHVS